MAKVLSKMCLGFKVRYGRTTNQSFNILQANNKVVA